MQELFNNLVITRQDGDTLTISCPLNLWSETGKHKVSVEIEAMHYFAQYYEDGEYNDLIGGE